MEAVDAGGTFELRHPSTGRVTASVDAREVFQRIVSAAWETGDPGLVFLDEMNRRNPTPAVGAFETTNPCGEVPLLPYESCVLGSINLAHMVHDTDVDWARLRHLVHTGARFLDDMIEVGREPVVTHFEVDRHSHPCRAPGIMVPCESGRAR
jgi:ribonucleoside-diphosphate reductase alpha chain